MSVLGATRVRGFRAITDVDGVLEGAGFDREVGNEAGGRRGNAGGVVADRCLGGFGAFVGQGES